MLRRTEYAPPPIPVPPEPIKLAPSERPFRTVRRWLRAWGPLDSILDVGCGDSPASTWGAFRRRYSIDPCRRPELLDVHPVRGLYPDDWDRGHVDVITCLDVLPGLVNPQRLAWTMLAGCDRLILSVVLTRGRWLADPRRTADLPIGCSGRSAKLANREIGVPGGESVSDVDPLGIVQSWCESRAADWEIERTNPPRLIACFARPSRPTVGQVVFDRRSNLRFIFERWLEKHGRRYAQLRDAAGGRHQLAEQFLRAG